MTRENPLGWYLHSGLFADDHYNGLDHIMMDAGRALGCEIVPKRTGSMLVCAEFVDSMELPDFVIMSSKNTNLARLMENRGVKVFNSPDAIDAADSKSKTAVALWKAGVPQPAAVLDPIERREQETPDTLAQYVHLIGEKLGYPLIGKYDRGSFGAEVFKYENEDDVLASELIASPKRILFQEFISESAGTDIRICVCNGKVSGAMRRRGAEGDFRSNIGAGGHGEVHIPTEAEAEVALAATAALGLDYSGVDILMSDRGPVVCEVNSNPQFLAFTQVTGIPFAEQIVEYALGVTFDGNPRAFEAE